jgi:hypothetical protein
MKAAPQVAHTNGDIRATKSQRCRWPGERRRMSVTVEFIERRPVRQSHCFSVTATNESAVPLVFGFARRSDQPAGADTLVIAKQSPNPAEANRHGTHLKNPCD